MLTAHGPIHRGSQANIFGKKLVFEISPNCPQEELRKLIREKGAEFYSTLSEDEKPRIAFVHSDGYSTGYHEMDRVGVWGLADCVTEDGAHFAKFKQRADEVILETQKQRRIESIPTMTDEELAGFLREYPDCVKATAEALARILTKIDNG